LLSIELAPFLEEEEEDGDEYQIAENAE